MSNLIGLLIVKILKQAHNIKAIYYMAFWFNFTKRKQISL